MKKYDFIFLDLDGPILDGKKKHYKCYKDIIDCFNGIPLNTNLYWMLKRSMTDRKLILEQSHFNGSYDIFSDLWLRNIEKEEYLILDDLKPQARETMQRWKSIGHKIILVTMRQNRVALLKQLKRLGIYDIFERVIDCPPHIQNTKYEKLKAISFQRAIFIGDTEEDTNTAKMLNIKSIGITNGLREECLIKADYYYKEIKHIDLEGFI